MDRIWMVEYDDYSEGWTTRGLFTTKALAEKFVADALTDTLYEYDRADFRIDWLPLDTEYELYEETDFETESETDRVYQ